MTNTSTLAINRSITELWQEYKDYRQRYQDFYSNVHGDILDFSDWIMAVDRYEDEMPCLMKKLEGINPVIIQNMDRGWTLSRSEDEHTLWQKIADLENALAL